MDFFYPNFNNDFWRVMGLVHFGDAQHFVVPGRKRFNYDAVVDFCRTAGLAFFDTASKVRRLKDNASDAFLEVLAPTDVGALLARLPRCRTIVTTGGKASEQLAALLHSASLPSVTPGTKADYTLQGCVADSTFRGPSPVTPGLTGSLPAPNVILSAAKDPDSSVATLPQNDIPAPGSSVDITAWGRAICWWRMPSTSRAYPLPLSAKAATYALLWQ